jgi:hypothetical protein
LADQQEEPEEAWSYVVHNREGNNLNSYGEADYSDIDLGSCSFTSPFTPSPSSFTDDASATSAAEQQKPMGQLAVATPSGPDIDPADSNTGLCSTVTSGPEMQQDGVQQMEEGTTLADLPLGIITHHGAAVTHRRGQPGKYMQVGLFANLLSEQIMTCHVWGWGHV